MGGPQVVVVVVHRLREVQQRLTGVAGRERIGQPVAERDPRQVEGDVDGGRDGQQGKSGPADREAPAPAGAEPAVGGGSRRIDQRRRVVRGWRRSERPEAEPAREPERPHRECRDPQASEREREGRRAEPERNRSQRDHRAGRGGARDGDPDLLDGPGDRVEDSHCGGHEGDPDHDREEGEVSAGGLAGGHRDGHVAEHRGDQAESQDDHHASEGRPDEDQETDRRQRVEGDPFRREAQTQQDADERHPDPEGASPSPGTCPDRGEQGDGRDDEERRVRVVHPDPLLDEEHPVQQAEDAGQDRHRPPPKQDPGKEEEEAGHQRARDDARQPPRERVLADRDAGGLPVRGEHEELFSVGGGKVRVDVRRPGGRREWEARVGEDAVPPRLHGVDGPCRPVRRPAQRVDDLAGRIHGHPADRAGHPDGLVDDRGRPIGRQADRGKRASGRRVEHWRIEPIHLHQARGPRLQRHQPGRRAALRFHEVHARGVGNRHPRDARDAEAAERAARNRGIQLRPLVLDVGGDGHPRRGGAKLRLVRCGRPTEDPCQLGGDGSRVVHARRVRHERIDRAGVDDLGAAGQPERGEPRAARAVERDERVVGRRGDQRRSVVGHPQPLHVADGRRHRVEGHRGRAAGIAGPQVDLGDRRVEGQHVAGRGSDVETMAAGVDRDGLRARQHERRQALACRQVEDPDVRPGRDVQPVTSPQRAPVGAGRLVPARLDRDIGHRHIELARGHDRVVAERDKPAGHRVLGEVRMGVLVDRVRLAVAPVLQELGGRPGVVDLVEVHPRRLAEPEGPQEERCDDEHDDEPQVEPVQPPAALAIELARPIEAGPPGQPARAPGRPADERGAREPSASRRVLGPGPEPDGRPGRPRVLVDVPGSLREQRGRGIGLLGGRADQERDTGQQPTDVEDRAERHAAPGADCFSELAAQPAERGQHRVQPQVLVEGLGQDPVEIRRVCDREHCVHDSPARADGQQDGPQREKREEIALVDSRGKDEEGDGHDREGDEERPPVVAPPDRRREQPDDAEQQRSSHDHGGNAKDGEPCSAVGACHRGVPDPRPVERQAGPVLGHERPRIERVHGQPRVAGGGIENLAKQPHDGQPERQAQDLGRGQSDECRREQPAGSMAGRPGDQVAAQDQDRRQRDQDPELGLDDGCHRRQQRGALVPAAPELAHREEQDQRPDGVDLRPDRAVEPGDRNEQDHRGRRERWASAGSEVRGEEENGDRQAEVGQDRRQLEEGARCRTGPAEGLRHQAQGPQDVEIPGRVVDEDRAIVDPEWPVPGELDRPAVERADVNLEPGPGKDDVCDDDPKGEAERKKDAERDCDVPEPHPGPLAGPRSLARCGASQGERPP